MQYVLSYIGKASNTKYYCSITADYNELKGNFQINNNCKFSLISSMAIFNIYKNADILHFRIEILE